MKIRDGFVSNSSSSSFVIYGVCIDDEEMKKLVEKNCPSSIVDFNSNMCAMREAAIRKALDTEENDVSVIIDWDNHETYVGKHPFYGMKDSQTKRKFVTDIDRTIKIIFGDDKKCTLYEGTIYG